MMEIDYKTIIILMKVNSQKSKFFFNFYKLD